MVFVQDALILDSQVLILNMVYVIPIIVKMLNNLIVRDVRRDLVGMAKVKEYVLLIFVQSITTMEHAKNANNHIACLQEADAKIKDFA